MFPLHTGDELFFSVSPNPHQQYKIPQDLILGPTPVHDSNSTKNLGKSRGGKLCAMDTDKISSDDNNNNKKMMHRDIERQRRQEMATLFASLRNLLPLEFLKGKRSISDQMNEAVNYIKYQEKKIKEMNVKREELKRSSNLCTSTQMGSSDDYMSPSCFVVRPSLVGLEIVYSCGYLEQGFPLSKVLQMLLEERLCVVNCVSIKVNERLLHTIQIEVNDPSSFNLSELEQKLITQVK